MKRIFTTIAILFSLLFFPSTSQATGTAQMAGSTTRISLTASGEQANGYSTYPVISGDGRYVVFCSDASNLVPTNGANMIFVKDRQTNQVTLVSATSSGVQGNGYALSPAITNDGRYISFYTNSTNMGSNGWEQIFVRDQQTNQVSIVSVSSGGVQGNNASFGSSISGDGRFVAFESDASNLVTGDTNGKADIFVHDRQTGQTSRISVSPGGTQGFGYSTLPVISEDGRFVTFASSSTNMVAGDTNAVSDIFVRDLQTGLTERASLSSSGEQDNTGATLPSISGNGRYVVFQSSATNLVVGDTNGNLDVFVHDRQTGQTIQVSVSSSGEQSNGSNYNASISADGMFVAFESDATNLVSGDLNGKVDIYLHNLQTGETTLVSLASGGTQGNLGSSYPNLSANGEFVVFYSDATNLVSGDTNNKTDIFLRDRGVSFYSLSGRIGLENGKPLPGARISDGQGHSTLSNPDGTYTLAGLPEGSYTISVEKRGYSFPTASIPVIISGGDEIGVNFTAQLPQWTLMYYFAADNDLGNTYPAIFNQLEAAAGSAGVSISVFWDQPGTNNSAYYWVMPDGNLASPAAYVEGENLWQQGELNTGDPTSLSAYLNWAMDYLPASHYAVILDDHGSGLGGAMLDETSGRDLLTLEDLQTGLEQVVPGHQKIDVLVMNACLMGLVEDGYQFRALVDYYAASEDLQTTFSPGYATSIQTITQNTTPQQAATAFVSGYADEMQARNIEYTMSAANLGQVVALKTAIENLAGALSPEIALNAGTLWTIQQTQVLTFPHGYIDLYDFARLVKENFTDAAIQASAQAVMDAVQNDYIVFNRSNDPKAWGVSFFFPDLRSSYYNGGNYDFAIGTNWAKSGVVFNNPGKEPVGWGNLLAAIFNYVDPGGADDPNPPMPVAKELRYSLFMPAVRR